jgi:hypothetical protein
MASTMIAAFEVVDVRTGGAYRSCFAHLSHHRRSGEDDGTLPDGSIHHARRANLRHRGNRSGDRNVLWGHISGGPVRAATDVLDTHQEHVTMKPTYRLLALAAVPLLTLAACGDPETATPGNEPGTIDPAVTVPSTDPITTSPGAGTPELPADATTVPPGAPDIAAAIRRAASLLGSYEADVPGDVRIARRGDEGFALTMDLVPGRLNVELDDDGTGEYVVTSVAIETEDGSEIVTVESLLENAASYLGTPEPGLDPFWRIGRRGDETFALTEDFVVGRFTVELDDDGTGAFVVTGVTVELPGGARTVTEETLLADAAALIGAAEAELPDDARIARRGDEFLALTQDYRIGRFTYELDDDGTGTFRVAGVQVELPDGVETVVAQS